MTKNCFPLRTNSLIERKVQVQVQEQSSTLRSKRLVKVGFFTLAQAILILGQLLYSSTSTLAAPTSETFNNHNKNNINYVNSNSSFAKPHLTRNANLLAFQGFNVEPGQGQGQGLSERFKSLDGFQGGIWREIIADKVEDYLENCTLPALWEFPRDMFTRQQRQYGAVILHLIASAYIFYALLIICDQYFVPSVESICRELKMPSDVAGATFMAASTSAPELFTNFIGTFVTKGTMGLGTIVGSAVFNILAVATICGIGAGWAVEKLKAPDGRVGIPLEWWPLTRDSIFYVLSVGALIIVLFDLRVVWYESVALIAFYGLYIVALYFNATLKQWTEGLLRILRRNCCNSEAKKKRHRISRVAPVPPVLKPFETTPLLLAQNEHGVTRPAKIDPEPKRRGGVGEGVGGNNGNDSDSDISLSSNDFDELLISKALLRSASTCIDQKADVGLFKTPAEGTGCLGWLWWVLAWPINCILTLTIPDCRKYAWRKWYGVTLLMCVIWIGGLSYILSWMMTVISDTIGIPDSVTGLTLLAMGTSIPEIFSSVIVARQGLGAMALSNSIGSNTFDILICLGLPWLVQSIVLGINGDMDGGAIHINSGGLELSSMLLVAILVILYIVLVWNGFWLDRKVGVISLIMYVVFIVIAILLEMNVFFPVNLPVCRLSI